MKSKETEGEDIKTALSFFLDTVRKNKKEKKRKSGREEDTPTHSFSAAKRQSLNEEILSFVKERRGERPNQHPIYSFAPETLEYCKRKEERGKDKKKETDTERQIEGIQKQSLPFEGQQKHTVVILQE